MFVPNLKNISGKRRHNCMDGLEKPLNTCSGNKERCTFYGTGSASYHHDGHFSI